MQGLHTGLGFWVFQGSRRMEPSHLAHLNDKFQSIKELLKSGPSHMDLKTDPTSGPHPSFIGVPMMGGDCFFSPEPKIIRRGGQKHQVTSSEKCHLCT